MVTVPFCRCRVLYIGSAVPTMTKDGLQGIQQPLRERYPTDENADTKGIDSWLSVWSNGILLEYIDGEKKSETAFLPINSLHYCAAVRYVNVTGYAIEGGGQRFLPLDSPFANDDNSRHPPIFAAIFRRTTGIKVLECHAFICTNSKAANALVRCCFHAYAESMYIKMEEKQSGMKAIKESSRSPSPENSEDLPSSDLGEISPTDEKEKWAERAIDKEAWEKRQQSGEYDTASISSSVVNRLRGKKNDNERAEGDRRALIPCEGSEPCSRRAVSDIDINCPEMIANGYFPPFAIPLRDGPPFMGAPFPPPPIPHYFRMIRSPFIGGIPPHYGLPPPPPIGMMPPPHPFGMLHRFPPGMIPPPFPPVDPLLASRLMGPYGPISPATARPRTPTDGPIITGPESLCGTLPRRTAFEEPTYMPGSVSYMPPQASYQPSHFPSEQYDAYYDTYRRRRMSVNRDKVDDQSTSKMANARDAENSSPFWDAYESGIYRRPHLNEKAFFATVQNTQSAVDEISLSRQLQNMRPETPPADYENTFDQNSVAKPNNTQRTTAVMY
ncbi:hypothetical protein AB6A40_004973 [Gnathostoma spinigerum]|uniref:PID domain-containing protein n=1 Tax=Gnathostoma spinigerum TaxID=75299 RepID=A0ABD6EJD7_9BILA